MTKLMVPLPLLKRLLPLVIEGNNTRLNMGDTVDNWAEEELERLIASVKPKAKFEMVLERAMEPLERSQ